jgi:hypothetical protein
MKTKFLSDGNSNSKTAKNLRKSYILYLAPFTQNSKGINLCPKASAGCVSACLFTAGRGAFSNVANARIKRTESMLSDRMGFVNSIVDEMNSYAKKHEGDVAVRLNGTSDIKLVEWAYQSMRHIESNIVFYDYTKIPSKAGERTLPSGHRYVVALSRSETNEADVLNHLSEGGIAAVVFNELPETWNGYKVYDGDSRDDLMLDIQGGGVLGLKAKGKARKDNTGFVVA